VARAGYNTASLSYSVFAGQTLDAGTSRYPQIATTAIVRGRVTAATGGAALGGVSISVIGNARSPRDDVPEVLNFPVFHPAR